MKLFEMPENKLVRIDKLVGGRCMLSRLSSLGIFKNSVLYIVRSANSGGPMLVRLDNSLITLGREICNKITVEEIYK